MDKEKLSRKRLSNYRENLPPPPPDPTGSTENQPAQSQSQSKKIPDSFLRILDYKKREKDFLKNLSESITMDCNKLKNENDKRQLEQQPQSQHSLHSKSYQNIMNDNVTTTMNFDDNESLLRNECDNFIIPLLNRTGPSISAALVANDAFEQLNRLHGLLDQVLTFRDRNYQMRNYLSDIKRIQKKDSKELLNDGDISDTELDLEYNAGLLNTILAAGNSASNKRNSSKRQRERSKSVIADDIAIFPEKEIDVKPFQLRRQSVFSEGKAKVSKWTKVKAAFKWERANVLALNEGKSLDSGIGLTPVNTEVARYLRVPAPIPCTGSSADSMLSSSSGHFLSGGGSIPATPGTISSASSIEDVAVDEMRRDSSKSDCRCDSRVNINDEETRRSRSLDAESILSQVGQIKSKTPWKKVKNIIQTHRGSFKGKVRSRSTKSNTSEKESRDVSPCGSIEPNDSSEQHSPTQKNLPNAMTMMTSMDINKNQSNLSSTNNYGTLLTNPDDSCNNNDNKITKTLPKLLRKSKILTEFEVLPEDKIVEPKKPIRTSLNRPPPSPLNLSVRIDSSDPEFGDSSYSPTIFLKNPCKMLRNKKSITSGNSSVPSSPSRHSEFFGEFESEDLSSGDFSEPSTPHRKLSEKSNNEMITTQKDEINERYLELIEKINQEFECKRQEWEKIRSACCTSTSCAYQIMSKEESKNLPLLEENLSADFKKKLQKWRVKKQISMGNIKGDSNSPTKESDSKKIDWNLWKTGQIKLDGQGLTPLPDQKNLPEDFQKKLEQWKKMKDTNTVPSYQNQNSSEIRRSSGKFGMGIRTIDNFKKSNKQDEDKSDRDKQQRPERDKNKSGDKDKSEKLSKLKAIVTDPRAKEIEVQTSVGIMKFEGISRKFTRKLYEWEKARGIGPESSTFALLHPGYRPLDVGKVSNENRSRENSPNLGRSLSLDSISPNPSMLSMSHQTSSLSLNDVSDIKDSGSLNERKVASNPEMDEKDQQDEPEAVIVEVEDDIVETAAPLVTALPLVEQQTPIYKYENIACNDFCSARKLLNFEAQRNNKMCDETIESVKKVTTYFGDHKDNYTENIRHVMTILTSLQNSIPDLENYVSEQNPNARNSMEIVKLLVSELIQQLNQLNEDEACCQETINERTNRIEKNLQNLQKSINLVCQYVKNYSKDILCDIPKINITSDEGDDKSVATISISPTVFQSQIIINQPRVLIDGSHKITSNSNTSPLDSSEFSFNASQSQPDFSETSSGKKVNRNVSNGSKKKTRLRKMGSRQNSKTESDSSDEDLPNTSIEPQRRIKRKLSRNKKSIDIDVEEEKVPLDNNNCEETFAGGDDIVYVLKIKPGKPIEQEKIPSGQADLTNVLISPTESCVQLLSTASQENLTSSANIFVKTKRKIFTAISGFGSNESTAVLAKDLESSTSSDRNERESSRDTVSLKSLPPLPQSPNLQKKLELSKSLPKEPSPSIRMMIAKYNQQLETDRTSKSPMSSGTCTPSSIRSPVLERRVVMAQTNKYEQKLDIVQKSASAGNISANNTNNNIIVVPILIENKNEKNRLSKSYSAEVLPWKNFQIFNNEVTSKTSCVQSLACDSLRIINKSSGAITKLILPTTNDRKEHLYRKNKEKPTSLLVGKAAAMKKIDSKNRNENIWRRCESTGEVDFAGYPLQPDKSDNTIPRITRKLEAKAITPTEKSHPKHGDLWHPIISIPDSGLDDSDQPRTPLTQRAIKLQRAKEEFLRGSPSQSPSISHDGSKLEFWKHRLSQASVGSETSNENIALLKSASVGMISGDHNTPDNRSGGYDSLPRNVSRSSKFSSKLGFATLASKFRKVKMRGGVNKDDQQIKMNTVSELCRQSLLLDFHPEVKEKLDSSAKSIVKSKSLQISGVGSIFKPKDKDKDKDKDKENNINKSKSAHQVPNDKK